MPYNYTLNNQTIIEPVPVIEYVDQRGTASITWNVEMQGWYNLTALTALEYGVKPVLDIRVLPGNEYKDLSGIALESYYVAYFQEK